MTYREALYVVAHRHDCDDATYHWALDIVEAAERQNPHLREERA